MPDPLSQALRGALPNASQLTTGTVVDVSATTLSVLVHGSTLSVAYLSWYSNPAIGDLVSVLRQGGSWLVLGTLAGVGPNAVDNGSFETPGADGDTVPDAWNQADLQGTAGVGRAVTGYAPAGQYELTVSADDTAVTTYVYGNPIPVNPGETWAAAALATALYPDGVISGAQGALVALFFDDEDTLYPGTSGAAISIDPTGAGAQTGVDLLPGPQHVTLSGTVVIPSYGAFMRIATWSNVPAGSTAQWDAVTARRVAA